MADGKSNKKTIIIVVIVLLVLVAIVVFYFYFKNPSAHQAVTVDTIDHEQGGLGNFASDLGGLFGGIANLETAGAAKTTANLAAQQAQSGSGNN